MNLVLILANIIGFLLLSLACLKVLETGPVIGPAFSPAARLVLLAMVFLGICAAIEAAACRTPMRPGATALVFVVGVFSVWRTWAPTWASFFTRQTFWPHRIAPPPL